MYTIEKIYFSPLCILCTLIPKISNFPTLTLVCTYVVRRVHPLVVVDKASDYKGIKKSKKFQNQILDHQILLAKRSHESFFFWNFVVFGSTMNQLANCSKLNATIVTPEASDQLVNNLANFYQQSTLRKTLKNIIKIIFKGKIAKSCRQQYLIFL